MARSTQVSAWGACLALTGCIAGGGSGGGAGSGEPADAGACDPVAGEYTVVWTLDDGDSDEACLQLEPATTRVGAGQTSADCAANCTCEQTLEVDEDGNCAGTTTTECAEDDDLMSIVYCAFTVAGGDSTFNGRCELEVFTEDETLGYCAHDVAFTRTGD